MATKNKELHVDELLGSYEPSTKSKETKTTKQSNNDWAEEEEENYAFGIAKDQQAATKKAQKKKGAGKGWADVEAAQQQAQPKTSDFAKIQEEEQKKKIIKKPGQARATTGVDIGSEAFPSLGEAPTKPAPKKTEPTPVVAPAQTDDGFSVVGPKRFINAKKKEAGEHFAPLDPTVVEKPVPVAPVREKVENPEPTTTTQAALPRGIFHRAAEQQPAEIPTDTKFKFGGEGPKKFSGGSKISFKREEEKDDHVALQLQKEREIEEKLQREKEEAAKQRENREKKHQKEGTSTEHHQGQDERKRFTNTKKEGDKPRTTQPEKPQPVTEVVVESTEPKQAKETVEMHGSLSNKAWGDGPILKKKK